MLIVFVLKDNSVFSFKFEITRLACFSLEFHLIFLNVWSNITQFYETSFVM